MNDDLSDVVYQHFQSLPQPEGVVVVEYVWIGGSGSDLRSTTRRLDIEKVTSLDDIPTWSFDGCNTQQDSGRNSWIQLKPIRMYFDPFRRVNKDNLIVLCECTFPDERSSPIPTNTRRSCERILRQCDVHAVEYGFKQEYTIFNRDCRTPLGWPVNGFPKRQGPFFCSVGSENAFGRRIAEVHFKACMYAGVHTVGYHAEVLPGGWSFETGPTQGIHAADDNIMARFLLHRVAEEFGVVVSFDPKPMKGDWSGAGCFTAFSTASMRGEDGFAHIIRAVERLGHRHNEHIAVYGLGNERRLTGTHETSHIRKFSYGIAHSAASVFIPRECKIANKGWFQDRRPASNCDPYQVAAKLASTCILNR